MVVTKWAEVAMFAELKARRHGRVHWFHNLGQGFAKSGHRQIYFYFPFGINAEWMRIGITDMNLFLPDIRDRGLSAQDESTLNKHILMK